MTIKTLICAITSGFLGLMPAVAVFAQSAPPTTQAPATKEIAPPPSAVPNVSPVPIPQKAQPGEADYDPTRPSIPRLEAAKKAPAIVANASKPTTPVVPSFLWEVKSPTATVYLFGTIHVGKRSFYPLPAAVENALNDSAKLVVEADITQPDPQGEILSLISYVPPASLDKNLPAPIYERLRNQLAKFKIPEAGVKGMKPFVVGGLLSLAEFSRLGYDMNLGVDAYLLARAKESAKPVLELESARGQMDMMANMPTDLQEAFLDNAISSLESGKTAEQVTGMVNAWQAGDAKLILEVANDATTNARLNDRIEEILLYQRNVGMQKKIEGYLAGKETMFVAVGSLHLVGKRGLLEGLKARGYEVTQK